MTDKISRHTPGPWKWFTNHICSGPLKGAFIDAQGPVPARIADVLSHGGVGSQEACEANAAFIVRACNSHEELLAACKAVVEDYLHLAQDADGTVDAHRHYIYRRLKSAILKSEGGAN